MNAADAMDESAAPAVSLAGSGGTLRSVLRVTVGPILAALVSSGVILLLLGVNPLTYYGFIAERGLFSSLGLAADGDAHGAASVPGGRPDRRLSRRHLESGRSMGSSCWGRLLRRRLRH